MTLFYAPYVLESVVHQKDSNTVAGVSMTGEDLNLFSKPEQFRSRP